MESRPGCLGLPRRGSISQDPVAAWSRLGYDRNNLEPRPAGRNVFRGEGTQNPTGQASSGSPSGPPSNLLADDSGLSKGQPEKVPTKEPGEDSKASEYVKIEGKGSTGRTIPNDLVEKMAMDNTKRNPFIPGEGNTVRKVSDKLNDRRWEDWEKWEVVYRTNVGRKVTIHFSYDAVNHLFDDFKFKN